MKIYVDELPKDCENCPCREDVVLEKERLKWVECNIQDINKTHTENIEGHNVEVIDCTLELIADHDKEKDHRIAVLERALDFVFKNAYEVECENLNGGTHISSEKEYVAKCKKFVIAQSEKELKDGEN